MNILNNSLDGQYNFPRVTAVQGLQVRERLGHRETAGAVA